MSKIPKSLRLFPGAFIIAVACFILSGVSGCGPQGDGNGGKPNINQDTLRNHVIPIELAVQYTKSFRGLIDSNYHLDAKANDSLKFDRAESFPADIFYDLLAQTDPKQGAAKGIRIYLGRDAKGQLRMILVPVDSLGNDIINHLVDQKGSTGAPHVESLQVNGGQGFEEGQQCPTVCNTGGSGL